MRATRIVLLAGGFAMGLWGLWLIRDFRLDQLLSAMIWLAGGVIAHDGILAPVVVGIGVVLARITPRYARKPVTVGLILWGTVTMAVANVLSGQGGKADNDSILDRPYVSTWLVMTLVVLAGVAVMSSASRRRLKAETGDRSES